MLVDVTVRVASDGAVDGFVLDLTEQEEARRALAESEQRFRGICATAQDAILMLDERGHIVFWNAAATGSLAIPRKRRWATTPTYC